MMDTTTRDAKVTVHFSAPVEGVDPDDGQPFLASRHRLQATWMRQDCQDTLFLDGGGEVVAGWQTDLVDEVVWSEAGSVSIALRTRRAEAAERLRVLRATYPHAYERWQPEEDERLTTAFHESLTVAEMVERHGRARGGIMARLLHLGLIDRDTLEDAIGADPTDSPDA